MLLIFLGMLILIYFYVYSVYTNLFLFREVEKKRQEPTVRPMISNISVGAR